MDRTAHLIFNPVSGQGNSQEDLALLRSRLEPNFDLAVYETSPECDANVLAAQSVRQGVDLVIVSWGDGTINAAAEALMGAACSPGGDPSRHGERGGFSARDSH